MFKKQYDSIFDQIEISNEAKERLRSNLHIKRKGSKAFKMKRVWAPSLAGCFVILLSTITLASNPEWASKIPLIGNLFKETNTAVEYSNVLEGLAETVDLPSVSDSGYTVDVVNQYCDREYIYFTVTIESKEGFPDNIMKDEVSDSRIDIDYNIIDLNHIENSPYAFNSPPEISVYGKLIDDNTFVGVFRDEYEYYDLPDETDEVDIEFNIERLTIFTKDNEVDYKLSAEDLLEEEHDYSGIGSFDIKGDWSFNTTVAIDDEVTLIDGARQLHNGKGILQVSTTPFFTYIDVQGYGFSSAMANGNEPGDEGYCFEIFDEENERVNHRALNLNAVSPESMYNGAADKVELIINNYSQKYKNITIRVYKLTYIDKNGDSQFYDYGYEDKDKEKYCADEFVIDIPSSN